MLEPARQRLGPTSGMFWPPKFIILQGRRIYLDRFSCHSHLQAKRNLVEKYLVVGVTEDLESFIEIVEWLLPKFFRGAASLYKQEGTKGNVSLYFFLLIAVFVFSPSNYGNLFGTAGFLFQNHIRRTKHKDTVSEATMSVLKNTKIWRAEQDFYDFALAQFNAIKDERAKSLKSESPDKPHFHYERLKGPNA